MFGRAKLQQQLLTEQGMASVFNEVRRKHDLSKGDFPDWQFMARQLQGYDFTESGFVAAARAVAHLDYWTINEPEQMRRLVDAGADGIITDRPDLLLEVLGRR